MNCKNLSKFTMVGAVMFGLSSMAEDGAKFEEAKANASKHLAERAANISEAQACVTSASDRDGLKNCFKNLHSKQKEMRMDFMEKRHERVEARAERVKKKIEEKKEKQAE